MGFPPEDVEILRKLVRLHLLLPDVATRRDLSDPVTVTEVAKVVGDVETLDLLHALCRADAAATGTESATSPWRLRLIADLVERVRAMVTGAAMPPTPSAIDPVLMRAPVPTIDITGDHVTVVAADRRGLLASVAGVLALHRLEVIGADTATAADRAVVRVGVVPKYGTAPDRTRLAADLWAAATGTLPVERLARVGQARRSAPVEPSVTWHADATDAVVLEVRATDSSGLLYRVTRALELAGANIRTARVATLGSDVVDAFYLDGSWSDEAERARVVLAVSTAAGGGHGNVRRVCVPGRSR